MSSATKMYCVMLGAAATPVDAGMNIKKMSDNSGSTMDSAHSDRIDNVEKQVLSLKEQAQKSNHRIENLQKMENDYKKASDQQEHLIRELLSQLADVRQRQFELKMKALLPSPIQELLTRVEKYEFTNGFRKAALIQTPSMFHVPSMAIPYEASKQIWKGLYWALKNCVDFVLSAAGDFGLLDPSVANELRKTFASLEKQDATEMILIYMDRCTSAKKKMFEIFEAAMEQPEFNFMDDQNLLMVYMRVILPIIADGTQQEDIKMAFEELPTNSDYIKPRNKPKELADLKKKLVDLKKLQNLNNLKYLKANADDDTRRRHHDIKFKLRTTSRKIFTLENEITELKFNKLKKELNTEEQRLKKADPVKMPVTQRKIHLLRNKIALLPKIVSVQTQQDKQDAKDIVENEFQDSENPWTCYFLYDLIEKKRRQYHGRPTANRVVKQSFDLKMFKDNQIYAILDLTFFNP